MEKIIDKLIRYKPHNIQRLNEEAEKIMAEIKEEEHFDDLYDLRKWHFKQQLVPRTLIESLKKIMKEGVKLWKLL
jgi:hypothetical protein